MLNHLAQARNESDDNLSAVNLNALRSNVDLHVNNGRVHGSGHTDFEKLRELQDGSS